MICDTDDFLLIVQNWITDSATVIFTFAVFDDPKEPALGLRLQGRIIAVDPTVPGFTFRVGEGDFILVDLKAWTQVAYADRGAYPPAENIKEAFTLNRPGASIALWTLVTD
jgi:hypothetical protein